MFHTIPQPVLDRMQELERIDARDRQDGTDHWTRLRQVPPETGRFLALMAAAAPDGTWIEIGTSGGYSALWISLACAARGRTLHTYELLPEKARLARETFRLAGTGAAIELTEGDVRGFLPGFRDVGFCFLDAEKDIYRDCYEAIVPVMRPGGLLVADNVISHEAALRPMVAEALADGRVDGVVVPIGQGVLVCRKV